MKTFYYKLTDEEKNVSIAQINATDETNALMTARALVDYETRVERTYDANLITNPDYRINSKEKTI